MELSQKVKMSELETKTKKQQKVGAEKNRKREFVSPSRLELTVDTFDSVVSVAASKGTFIQRLLTYFLGKGKFHCTADRLFYLF